MAPHIGHPRAPRSQRGPRDHVITAMQITGVKPALEGERPRRAYGDHQEETGMTTVTAKPANVAALELTNWRRRVGELYAAVRALDEPERACTVALGPGRVVPDPSAKPVAAGRWAA